MLDQLGVVLLWLRHQRRLRLLQQLLLPAVGGHGPAAAPAAAVAGVGGSHSWIVVEASGGRARGEVVCVEPTALPPGHFQLGDVALVPGLPGVSDGSLVRRVPTNEVANYKLSDLRVLPIQFDPQGNRRREFSQAVSNLVDGVPQGGFAVGRTRHMFEHSQEFERSEPDPHNIP